MRSPAAGCLGHPNELARAAQEAAVRSLFDVIVSFVSRQSRMENLLSGVGSLLYGMRFTMLFFYGVTIIFGILGKFLLETYKLIASLLFGELEKIDLIIKVLELVDMTMVAQLVWVVALAGVSLFVTTGHFDKKDMKKPDWLDHVNPTTSS